MIGEFCSNIRHFVQNAECYKKKAALLIESHTAYLAYYFKMENGNIVFNDGIIAMNSCDTLLDDKASELIRNCESHDFAVYRPSNASDNRRLKQYFESFMWLLLPEDFEETYNNFISYNKKKCKLYIDKYGDINSKFSFALCNNSVNYYTWIIQNVSKYHIAYLTFHYLMQWCIKFPNLVSKLSKGTMTAYNGLDDIISLINEVDALMSDKRVNSSIMEFNTAQKRMLQQNIDDDIKGMLNRFYMLSEQIRKNFVQKMSSVTNLEELVHNLNLLCEYHFKWNRQSFLEYMENTKGMNYEIVFDENNCVVVKVNDYDTLRKITKTTNWCISKNKTYWNDIIGGSKNNATQYVLFNFNNQVNSTYSIIGFTVHKKDGIIRAHAFNNDNLITSTNFEPFLTEYPTYFKHDLTGIHKILLDLNIPLSLFNPNPLVDLTCNWDKNAVLDLIENNEVLKSQCTVVDKDTENKLVLKTNDLLSVITTLFKSNNAYYDICQDVAENYAKRHYEMLFFNFNENIENKDKLYISINKLNSNTPVILFNGCANAINYLYFFSLAFRTNLPAFYGMKRMDKLHKIAIALSNYDIEFYKWLVKRIAFKGLAKNNYRSYDMYWIRQSLYSSIVDKSTFALMDAVYESGLNVKSMIGQNETVSFMNDLYCVYKSLTSRPRPMNMRVTVPTQVDYENFDNGTIEDSQMATAIAIIKVLHKMFSLEPKETIIDLASEMSYHSNYVKELHTYLYKTAISNMENINDYGDVVKRIYDLAKSNDDAEVINMIMSKNPDEGLLTCEEEKIIYGNLWSF